MKKTLTALAIAGSLTFVGAGAVQAAEADYPAAEVATVSDSTVAPGEAFVFSGSGFTPGESISIIASNEQAGAAGVVGGAGVGGAFGAGVTGVIVPAAVINASAVAAEDGTFSTNLVLSETGTWTITAVGDESGATASAAVEVVSADGSAVPDDNTGAGAGIGAGAGDNSAANEEAVANGDRLADTGLESSALLWGAAGVLALGAGATAVVVSRRKNA